jgi:uncharacterized protein (TIGR02996 family)
VGLERAFLDDVIERPDDDAPRLVYADWLQDHGQEDRAEFIRVQCRLAAMDESDPERPALAERERELLDRYAVEWAMPLQAVIMEWSYRRGFIDFVRVEELLAADMGAFSAVFRLAPLEGLAMWNDGQTTASRLLSLGDQLRRLRYLDLLGLDDVPAGELRRLLTSPALANLRTLFIDQQAPEDFPVRSLDALGTSPALSDVTALGLALGEDAGDLPALPLRAVARSPYLRLRHLYLFGPRLDRRLLRLMLNSPACAGLETFSLEHAEITADAWPELLRPEALRRVSELRLADIEEMEDATIAALLARFDPEVLTFEPLGGEDNFFPRRRGFHWPSA